MGLGAATGGTVTAIGASIATAAGGSSQHGCTESAGRDNEQDEEQSHENSDLAMAAEGHDEVGPPHRDNNHAPRVEVLSDERNTLDGLTNVAAIHTSVGSAVQSQDRLRRVAAVLSNRGHRHNNRLNKLPHRGDVLDSLDALHHNTLNDHGTVASNAHLGDVGSAGVSEARGDKQGENRQAEILHRLYPCSRED